MMSLTSFQPSVVYHELMLSLYNISSCNNIGKTEIQTTCCAVSRDQDENIITESFLDIPPFSINLDDFPASTDSTRYSAIGSVVDHWTFVTQFPEGTNTCLYPKSTGSGEQYSSCCDAAWERYFSYFLPTPEGFESQTSCLNGIVYMTPQASMTSGAQWSQITDTIVTEKRRIAAGWYKVSSFDKLKNTWSQYSYLDEFDHEEGALVADAKQKSYLDHRTGKQFTHYPCQLGKSDCESWVSNVLDMDDQIQSSSGGFVQSVKLGIQYDKLERMCSDYYESEMSSRKAESSWTFTSSSIRPYPTKVPRRSCGGSGSQVTVYYFAEPKQRFDICDEDGKLDGLKNLSNVMQTNQTSKMPNHRILTTALTLPITQWDSWSWVSKEPPTERKGWDLMKQRTGSITSTIVSMAQNRVYLHFDKINIWRHGSEYVLHNQTRTHVSRSTLMDLLLEVETNDVSTFTQAATRARQVQFGDFDWPYNTKVWETFCGYHRACQTILQGELTPKVRIPPQISEDYPELGECLDFTAFQVGAIDPPRALTPVETKAGSSLTTLDALWSPINIQAQPKSHLQDILATQTSSMDSHNEQTMNINNAPSLPLETAWNVISGEVARIIAGTGDRQLLVYSGRTLSASDSVTLVDGRVLKVQEDGHVKILDKNKDEVKIDSTATIAPTVSKAKTRQSNQSLNQDVADVDSATKTTNTYLRDWDTKQKDNGQRSTAQSDGQRKKNEAGSVLLVWSSQVLLLFTCLMILL